MEANKLSTKLKRKSQKRLWELDIEFGKSFAVTRVNQKSIGRKNEGIRAVIREKREFGVLIQVRRVSGNSLE